MAAIILPSRWNRQPTGPCGVNHASPLALGLTHLISGAGWSATPAFPLLRSAAPHVIRSGPHGLGLISQALGDGYYCAVDGAQLNAARAWTLAIVGEIPADVSGLTYFALHSSTAPAIGSHDREITAGYGGGYFYLQGYIYSGGPYFATGTTPIDFLSGNSSFTCVLSCGGGNLSLFTNGRPDGTPTAVPGNGYTGYSDPAYLMFAQNGGPHRVYLLAKVDGVAWQADKAAEFHRNPWQLFRPVRRRIYIPSAGAGGVLAGTAVLGFGEGASSLTGGGALAGTSAITFDDGASTLTASGALAGSAAVTFGEGASSLTATGTLTGQIDLTFDDGASALTGAGALAGAAALVFANAGSLTDLTAGSIAGTAALTFTDTATATGTGALAGSSAITFTTAATAAGAGALAGAAALTFTNAGDLTNATSGAITGTAGLVFAEVAALTGAGALAGSAAMQITASAVISGGAFVTADRRFIAPTRSRSFNLSRSRVFRSE